MEYKELVERLKRLDEDASLLYEDNSRFRLVIVGGGALILLETIDRATFRGSSRRFLRDMISTHRLLHI